MRLCLRRLGVLAITRAALQTSLIDYVRVGAEGGRALSAVPPSRETGTTSPFRGRRSSMPINNGAPRRIAQLRAMTDKNTRNAIAIERSSARKGDGRATGEDGKDRGAEARRCGRGTKARDIQPYRSVYSLSGRPSQPPHKLMPMYLRGPGALYV